MARILSQVFRPWVLIGISACLVAVAALIVFQSEPGHSKPQPAAVAPGEQEIAFLYPATSGASWERFVAAVDHCQGALERLYPGFEVSHDMRPESMKTLAAPEITLRWPRARGRLVFRWYKLTSDWSTEAWVDALLARKPPPLAIIGGNSTYWARELALQLARAGGRLPEAKRPLLLLTTATADRVPLRRSGESDDRWGEEKSEVLLSGLYPSRTFRFCFTNRQMATAVTRFIWSRPELRPDSDPAFLTKWSDDAYSRDLFKGYAGDENAPDRVSVLDRRAHETLRDNLVQQWGFLSGCIAMGAHPASIACWFASTFNHEIQQPLLIDSSVGSFAAPNPYEAKVAQELLDMVADGKGPRRPLLVITGQAQPSRRFLRELARSAPVTSRRFVVAMGDSVSFNTIYRDRLVAWPIQDLPFDTVFFCHRNPIDEKAGFHPRQPVDPTKVDSFSKEPKRSASGTEDLLLFADIVEAVGLAFVKDGRPCADAQQLGAGLSAIRFDNGRLGFGQQGVPLFEKDGRRRWATGENVVYLRPVFEGDRVQPQAVIEVWYRQTSDGTNNVWKPYGKPLIVSYDAFNVHRDRSHD